jgi:hypothetical protein
MKKQWLFMAVEKADHGNKGINKLKKSLILDLFEGVFFPGPCFSTGNFSVIYLQKFN